MGQTRERRSCIVYPKHVTFWFKVVHAIQEDKKQLVRQITAIVLSFSESNQFHAVVVLLLTSFHVVSQCSLETRALPVCSISHDIPEVTVVTVRAIKKDTNVTHKHTVCALHTALTVCTRLNN